MPLTLWCSFFENTKQDLLLFIQRKISSQKFPNDKGNKILFYLWAQGDEVLSGDSHEFITITNQSEQDTRDRPLWRSGRFFYTFPTSAKNSVVAISLSDSFAKFCNSPNMGLLYCKYRSQNLRTYGPLWFTDNILYHFAGVFLSCFVSLARGLYGPQTDVVQLTANNFRSMVMDSDSVWLVEFFAPWYVWNIYFQRFS